MNEKKWWNFGPMVLTHGNLYPRSIADHILDLNSARNLGKSRGGRGCRGWEPWDQNSINFFIHYIVVFIILYVEIVNFIIVLFIRDINTLFIYWLLIFVYYVQTLLILILFLSIIIIINSDVFNIQFIFIYHIWCLLFCLI